MSGKALLLGVGRGGRLRLVATALGVAIGVASVVATLLATRAAIDSLAAGAEEVAGEARLELRQRGGVPDSLFGELAPFADRALFVPVLDENATAPALNDIVRILGVDLLVDGDVRALQQDPGDRSGREALDELLVGNGLVLSQPLADELGKGPDDTVELLVRSRRVELPVVSTFSPERFSSAWNRVALMDVAAAQEVFDARGRLDRIEVRPRGGTDLGSLAAELRSALPEAITVGEPADRRQETERMVRALEFNLTALSSISVLVGIVLVATTLATSVVQRRYPIALLRSLGASRRQIAGAVLVEAGGIGLAGGLLGALGGWLGAQLAVGDVRSTLATVVEGTQPGVVRMGLVHVLLAVLLGLVASLLAALLPLREALATPPLQGLAREKPSSARPSARRPFLVAALLAVAAWLLTLLPPWGDRPVWALLATLLLLSTLLALAGPLVDLLSGPGKSKSSGASPLRVAQAALAAGRQRASWAAGAVGVAVGLAVAMATMIGSFRETVVDWTDQAMRSDIFLRPLPIASGVPAGTIDPAVVEAALELFGEEAVDPFHSSEATLAGERVALAGAALGIAQEEGGVPFIDGRDTAVVFGEAREKGGAIVNEPLARRFGLGRGDLLRLETPGGPLEREIVGVFRDYSNHTGLAVIGRGDFLQHYPDEGARSVAIHLPDGSDAALAREQLMGALGGRYALEAILNRELRQEVLAVFDRTFAVTAGLQAVASVVAVIAVVSVLFALVGERRRELAVVRVLGGSRGQVARIVVGEAGLLGASGALGGVLVGLVVGWVLVRVVNVQSFGWTLGFEPPWGSLGRTTLAVLPACLLAGLLPAWSAARTTPQEVLRGDD